MKKLILAVVMLFTGALAFAHGPEIKPSGNVLDLTKDYAFNSFETWYRESASHRILGRERLWGLSAPLMRFHARAAMDASLEFNDGLREASLDFPMSWSKNVILVPSLKYLEEIDGFGFAFRAKVKLR